MTGAFPAGFHIRLTAFFVEIPHNGTFFYICGANTNHKSGGKQCKGHRVRKEYVDDDVLRLIQTHMKTVLDTENMKITRNV